MAKKKLTFWANQTGAPVADDDRLVDGGGNALSGLPANGSYDTTNGLGGPLVDFFSDGIDATFSASGGVGSVHLFKIAGSEKLLGGQNLVIEDFSDVYADFGSGRKDLNIFVENVENGEFYTGSGEDNVDLEVFMGAFNESSFVIDTASDDDAVVLSAVAPVNVTGGGGDTAPQVVFGLPMVNADLGSGNDSFDSVNLASNDMVDGGSGRDTITSGDGDDTIDGGSGDDDINAGNGNNDIFGGTGSDTITSGNGDDTIDSYSGDDVVNAGDGDNYITSGSGSDSVTSGMGDDTINSGTGNDTVDAGDGDNSIEGGSGNDFLNGGDGSDTISGGSGEDTLRGFGSDDTLYGDGNDDYIYAGGGWDVVFGGDGADTVYTHGGYDTIMFTDVADSGIGDGARDVIADFVQGMDVMDFSLIAPMTFIGGAAFSGGGEIRFYQTATDTIVEVDANGDTAVDMEIELSGLITLLGTDFIV